MHSGDLDHSRAGSSSGRLGAQCDSFKPSLRAGFSNGCHTQGTAFVRAFGRSFIFGLDRAAVIEAKAKAGALSPMSEYSSRVRPSIRLARGLGSKPFFFLVLSSFAAALLGPAVAGSSRILGQTLSSLNLFWLECASLLSHVSSVVLRMVSVLIVGEDQE